MEIIEIIAKFSQETKVHEHPGVSCCENDKLEHHPMDEWTSMALRFPQRPVGKSWKRGLDCCWRHKGDLRVPQKGGRLGELLFSVVPWCPVWSAKWSTKFQSFFGVRLWTLSIQFGSSIILSARPKMSFLELHGVSNRRSLTLSSTYLGRRRTKCKRPGCGEGGACHVILNGDHHSHRPIVPSFPLPRSFGQVDPGRTGGWHGVDGDPQRSGTQGMGSRDPQGISFHGSSMEVLVVAKKHTPFFYHENHPLKIKDPHCPLCGPKYVKIPD